MNKKLKAPARNAMTNKKSLKTIVEMDSDEISDIFERSVAGGEKREAKRKLKMKVSGKSVFGLKEIIVKKARKSTS
jgi:hypothetical protein